MFIPVVGEVVFTRGSYEKVREIRMMEEPVPTYCDGNFFDTNGPFCLLGRTWIYAGNVRELTAQERQNEEKGKR